MLPLHERIVPSWCIGMFCILIVLPVGRAATLTGHALLDGQSDHSGIVVTLAGSRTVPAIGWVSTLILLLIVSATLTRKNWKSRLPIVTAMFFGWGVFSGYSPSREQTVTAPSGEYAFENIEAGYYRLELDRNCYVSSMIDPVHVMSDDIIAETRTLASSIPSNHGAVAGAVMDIRTAEAFYQWHSPQHTYTGDIACLCSGNGAGGYGYLADEYADGFEHGYTFQITPLDPQGGGVYHDWELSATPQEYGCSGTLSFYASAESFYCPCTSCAGDIGGAPGHAGLPEICLGNPHQSTQRALMDITAAQTDYNNNSSPHTYTGPLACLCSGNGAGTVPFLCSSLADNELCAYQYLTGLGDYAEGSYWAWSCSAYPIVYGPDSSLSFYIDQTGIMRSGDLGGAPGDPSLPVHTPLPGGCYD